MTVFVDYQPIEDSPSVSPEKEIVSYKSQHRFLDKSP